MRRHSLSGVAGMSRCRMPSGFSASTRALVIAAGAPIAPASPQPLTPSGLWVHGVTLVDNMKYGRAAAGRIRESVYEPGSSLAGFLVVDAGLEQGLPDALGEAAMDLALDDHRVEDAPEIVAGGEIDDRDLPGFRVDLDLGDMGAGGEGKILWVIERGFVEAGLQFLVREVVRHVGGQRHLGHGLRPVGAGNGELAVLELDIGLGGFEQMRGDLAALGNDLVHRLDDRAAADGERPRAVGAHAIGDLVGIAVDDLDAFDRDAETIGDEL